MADPYDIGFGVPPVYTGEWPPPSWADALAQHPALQPGLGVPPSVADAAMSPAPSSDMVPDAQHLAAAGGDAVYSMPTGAPPSTPDQTSGLAMPPSPDAGPLPMPQMGPGAAGAVGPPMSTLGSQLSAGIDQAGGHPTGLIDMPSMAQGMSAGGRWGDDSEEGQAARAEIESNRLANDPMALAEAQFKQQQLRANEEHIARLASDRKTIENLQAKADADVETKKQSDQVLNQAWALAHSKIDPEQWMKSRSAPQKIAAVLASVLGGLVAPQNGGRNIGMEILNKAIEQNIEAQKENLANGWKGLEMQKGAVNDKRAADLAAFNNAESLRQASYQYAVNQIDDKLTALDPNGTRAVKLGELKAQVLGQMAASHNAFVQKTFENNLKTTEAQQKVAELHEKVINDRATVASANYGHAVQAEANRQAHLDRQDAIAARHEEHAAVRADKQGAHSIPGLKLDNGQVGTALAENVDDAGAEKLREEAAAVKNVVGIVDQMKAIRTGGTTKWGNSEEYQRLNALGGKLKFALKDYYKVKNITDIDEKLFDKMLGFDDPTKFRSFKAGIDQFRSSMLDDINSKLRGHGVAGSIDVPEYKKPQATPLDENMDFALMEPGGATPYLGLSTGGVHAMAKDQIIDMQREAVRRIADQVTGDPGRRAEVEAALGKIASSAQTPEVKASAESALQQIAPMVSSDPEPEPGVFVRGDQ